jgi:hypothetical protein
MNIESMRSFLIWCAVLNYTVLILWFMVFLVFGRQLWQMHSKWFALTKEQFDGYMYQGLMFYKIAVLIFNVAPLAALYLMK